MFRGVDGPVQTASPDKPRRNSRKSRSTTMKTMFLTLAAVLGIVLGTSALTTTAQASQVYLYPPAGDLSNG